MEKLSKEIMMSKHYHLIGIGGIGMSGIAQLLLCKGFKVSGSDVKESLSTAELKDLGAQIFIGHSPENIRKPDVVVYTSAVKDDNPEMRQAKAQGIPVIKRAQALAELMRDKLAITVAGSHGKTTTTSLASYLLLQAGFNPTIAVGGIFKNISNNVHFGDGDYFVAEADESDGSFLYYQPRYSIITNIDHEHLDYYGDFESEVKAFGSFIRNTHPQGKVFYCRDDRNLSAIINDSLCQRVSFGFDPAADIYPENIKFNGLNCEFDCIYKRRPLGRFGLSLGGRHNISNSLSIIGLGMELGIDLNIIRSSLAGYKGAGRRLEVKYKSGDYTVIDDYAHHPTEIKATLEAVKNLGAKRVIAVFQPHRYSRTKNLFNEFAGSFDLVDQLIVTDIYAASEIPIDGVSSQLICQAAQKRDPAKLIEYSPRAGLCGHVLEVIRPGDAVIFLGAGDITRISDELVGKIKN